jgi:ribosome biogenesis protein MAK21
MPDAGVDDDLAEDSDEIPSGLYDDEDGDQDDDQLSLVEGSDADDLIPLDEALASDLIDYNGSQASDNNENEDYEEWSGVGGSSNPNVNKRKRGEEKRETKKKLKSLPTFASYEDYAKLIENGPEDDI